MGRERESESEGEGWMRGNKKESVGVGWIGLDNGWRRERKRKRENHRSPLL